MCVPPSPCQLQEIKENEDIARKSCPCHHGYWAENPARFIPGSKVRSGDAWTRAEYLEHQRNCKICRDDPSECNATEYSSIGNRSKQADTLTSPTGRTSSENFGERYDSERLSSTRQQRREKDQPVREESKLLTYQDFFLPSDGIDITILEQYLRDRGDGSKPKPVTYNGKPGYIIQSSTQFSKRDIENLSNATKAKRKSAFQGERTRHSGQMFDRDIDDLSQGMEQMSPRSGSARTDPRTVVAPSYQTGGKSITGRSRDPTTSSKSTPIDPRYRGNIAEERGDDVNLSEEKTRRPDPRSDRRGPSKKDDEGRSSHRVEHSNRRAVPQTNRQQTSSIFEREEEPDLYRTDNQTRRRGSRTDRMRDNGVEDVEHDVSHPSDRPRQTNQSARYSSDRRRESRDQEDDGGRQSSDRVRSSTHTTHRQHSSRDSRTFDDTEDQRERRPSKR